MKEILFITGNERKVWQANDVLKQFGVTTSTKDLPIVEIQSHEPKAIVLAKAAAAFEYVGQPLVVCDHSWSFSALKGFPGGYMKDMNYWLEPSDFLALMNGKEDRAVILTEWIVYTDGTITETFVAEFRGKVTEEPRGKGHVACERVVIYDGSSKTIAEHIDAGEHARDMGDSAWVKFGKWYAEL